MGVALAWPNGSGPSPTRPCAVGNAYRCGHWAQRNNDGGRMGPTDRPTNNTPIHRIGQLLFELPPTTHFRQYGVGGWWWWGGGGGSEIRASALDWARNRLRREDRYRTTLPPAPSGIEERKWGGKCQRAPSLTSPQSPIFNLVLNDRWHREEAKVVA